MSLVSFFDRCLRLPELEGFKEADFDSPQAAQIQRSIFRNKKSLGVLYQQYCQPFLESVGRAPKNAKILEIGSGTSPLKDFIPSLMATDVFICQWLDLVSSAYFLPFKDQSLDRVFLMFTCHHLSRMNDFLDEAYRCLKPGSEMIIIDPAITPFSKVYYKFFHIDTMDLKTKEWGFEGAGRLSNSNIALAWIVFFRDRDLFMKKYPGFIIEKIEYNTCMAFLLSGGLRIRQLFPTIILKVLFRIENWFIRNISNKIAVTMVLTIKRR